MRTLINGAALGRAAVLSMALAAGTLGMAGKAAAQELTGAGSTFINPIMQQWIANYKQATGVGINYQSIGSGGGISGLMNHTVDFAGSDAPMNAAEMKQAGKPVIHIPVVIGAVCVAYNVPGNTGGLHMSGPVLAEIFLGNIMYWDAPEIAALNRGVRLPHERIFVAHRSDGSGTTFIFSDYLAKVSGDWKQRVGVGKSLHWPVGLGGKGSEGISGLIRSHPYSIGYVELAYAVENRIAYCQMQNAKGRFIIPTAQSGSLAAAGVQMPADMRVSITNTSNPEGYPITGFTWLIVYENSAKAADLKRFLDWAITTGQSYCAQLQYAAVPDAVRGKLKTLIAGIK
ncbi:MAG: phosphate ABC transporter substrate-binding protein PstS [Fimbriimonadales bacterium]